MARNATSEVVRNAMTTNRYNSVEELLDVIVRNARPESFVGRIERRKNYKFNQNYNNRKGNWSNFGGNSYRGKNYRGNRRNFNRNQGFQYGNRSFRGRGRGNFNRNNVPQKRTYASTQEQPQCSRRCDHAERQNF